VSGNLVGLEPELSLYDTVCPNRLLLGCVECCPSTVDASAEAPSVRFVTLLVANLVV